MNDFVYPLVAIRANGETIIATSPAEAADLNRLRPGPRHVEAFLYIAAMRPDGPIWRESRTEHDWIVRDAHGDTVLADDLPCHGRARGGWYNRRREAARQAEERGLPIPGTGRGRRRSRGYRDYSINIANRSAEKALDYDLADWDVRDMRVGRRRSHDLPRYWDDVAYRSNRRCWKDVRGTRWH